MSDSFIRFLQDFLCQGEVKSDKLKKLRKGSLVVCLRNAKIEDWGCLAWFDSNLIRVDLSRSQKLTFTDASSTGFESTAKAYKYFAEPGYLHNIKVTYGDSEAVVSARCYRSMKKNETPHSLRVTIEFLRSQFKATWETMEWQCIVIATIICAELDTAMELAHVCVSK